MWKKHVNNSFADIVESIRYRVRGLLDRNLLLIVEELFKQSTIFRNSPLNVSSIECIHIDEKIISFISKKSSK